MLRHKTDLLIDGNKTTNPWNNYMLPAIAPCTIRGPRPPLCEPLDKGLVRGSENCGRHRHIDRRR